MSAQQGGLGLGWREMSEGACWGGAVLLGPRATRERVRERHFLCDLVQTARRTPMARPYRNPPRASFPYDERDSRAG